MAPSETALLLRRHHLRIVEHTREWDAEEDVHMIIGPDDAEAFRKERLGDLLEEVVAPREPSDEDGVLCKNNFFSALLPLRASGYSPIQADAPFSFVPEQRLQYTAPKG